MSQFPGGVLLLNGLGNYYEVEHQAERLFSMPADRMAALASNAHLTGGSVWVMPAVREAFVKLQSQLSPANQKTWDQAARTPFEHSYLVNMLYRANKADTLDEFCQVLKRLGANTPNATVGEL